MTTTERTATETRPVTTPMRYILLLASALVFVAGLQLFVLTEHTDRFFAWTIGFPLSAAFLGAGYWAAAILELLSAREQKWVNARPAVPAVWLFTTLTAIATIVHFEVFDLQNAFALAWILIYFGVPAALGLILLVQLRTPGADPAPERQLPTWLRVWVGMVLVVMVSIGGGLFLAPTAFAGIWPWELTPLLSRAVGAWLIGAGTLKLQIIWENDWRRVRISFLTLLAWGLLILLAVARYRESVTWDAHFGAFLFVFLNIVVIGLYGVFVGWIVNDDTDRHVGAEEMNTN